MSDSLIARNSESISKHWQQPLATAVFIWDKIIMDGINMTSLMIVIDLTVHL